MGHDHHHHHHSRDYDDAYDDRPRSQGYLQLRDLEGVEQQAQYQRRFRGSPEPPRFMPMCPQPPPNMMYQQLPTSNGRYYNNPPPPTKYAQPPSLPRYHQEPIQERRKKSLLIGINYEGQSAQLSGCHSDVQNVIPFLASRGYSTGRSAMVVMTDERSTFGSPFFPTAHNILAAFAWLTAEPNCSLFLHYSGHGGQVENDQGEMCDTIVPVDYQDSGQFDSDMLHRRLVSNLHPSCTLHVIFDCCHSGSTLELPWVYTTDEDGLVGIMDNLQAGYELYSEASHLLQGGFTFDPDREGEARHLLAGAHDFFEGLLHEGSGDDQARQEGLSGDKYTRRYGDENKSVFMFSGCKDAQTSADAVIGGKHVGAMSWAFLETMHRLRGESPSYVQILQETRELLQGKYKQIPQLSCGFQFDLNRPMIC